MLVETKHMSVFIKNGRFIVIMVYVMFHVKTLV